ncbi:hypothetical protein M758_11G072900 [Ceratodon purpureus]|nr:hypothetical protein M758_11G072900 [Ceratodon purpureus]
MECRKVEKHYCRKVGRRIPKVQCEIHVAVVGSCSLHQTLRFALLASNSWLLLPLGILVWSVLHLLLMFVVTLLMLAYVIFLLCIEILFYFVFLPLYFFFAALLDVVVLVIDTLRCIFVTIRVFVSSEATPGTATKVAYERIGGIRLFGSVRTVIERGRTWFGHPFKTTFLGFQECWDTRRTLDPFGLQMTNMACEEIVPRYDVICS